MNITEFASDGQDHVFYVAQDDGNMFIAKIHEAAADDLDFEGYSGEDGVYDAQEMADILLVYLEAAWENATFSPEQPAGGPTRPPQVVAMLDSLISRAVALPVSEVLDDGTVDDNPNKTISLWIGDIENDLKKSASYTDRLKMLAGIKKS